MIIYLRDNSGGSQKALTAYEYEYHLDNSHESSFTVYSILDTDTYSGGVLIVPNETALLIKSITPSTTASTTAIKCSPLINIFDRSIAWAASSTLGDTVEDLITANWGAGQSDSYFAATWLETDISSDAEYAEPTLDDAGMCNFKTWLTDLEDAGTLSLYATATNSGVTLQARSTESATIIFGAGVNTLSSETYSNSVVSKITNHTDDDATDYYLFTDGSYSTDPDEGERVSGTWKHLIGKAETDVAAEFAKNTYKHKLTFYSYGDYKSGTHIRCRMADGRVINSIISCVKKSSKDGRNYYEAGILKTTLTELIGGLNNGN